MFRQIRFSSRLFVALSIVLAFLAASLASSQPVHAGGSGGINVRVARVCLNGVRFTGTVTNAAVLGRTVTSRIFRGHVGSPSPLVATGTSTVYTAVGQTRQFTVTYAVGTFAVGEAVTYSALANDTSGYGGGQFAYVQDCYLNRTLLPQSRTTGGTWTNVATLIEDTCGGAAKGATFPVTLTFGLGSTRLNLDWYAQHFILRPVRGGAFSGSIMVGDSLYRLTLTFTSATTYSGKLEVTFPSCPGRHWLIGWAGTADAH